MNRDMSYDSKEARKQSEGERNKGDRGGNKKGRRSQEGYKGNGRTRRSRMA
jgi:hypothetical protein